MSLPDDEVVDLLCDDFVVGWRNIQKDEHVGLSKGYRKSQTAVGTTNGAGGRNVQMIVLAEDETVLHVLPGFWHPGDLARELRFARTLHRLWSDVTRTQYEKERMYVLEHRSHVRGFSVDTLARSGWQSFDRAAEWRRRSELRDTFMRAADGEIVEDGRGPELKPLCLLVHERMVARPFVRFADFDVESFVDYGRPYYDNNAWVDKGKSFPAAERVNKKRETEQREVAARAARKDDRRQ